MRRQLQSLHLRAHPELSRLISMAWAVHRHRVRQPKYKESGKSLGSEVSRSSILYAGTILRQRIREIFEEAGLDFAAWTEGLEVSTFVPEPPPPAREDIDVEEEYFSAAMKRYSEVFGGRRSVDIYAVVFGLLATAQEGLGARRLTDAGMKIGEAAGLLFEEMKPDTGLVSTAELSRFELSQDADAIVRQAMLRAAGFERNVPLTASLLLIALAEAGAKSADGEPASFLRAHLDSAQPGRFDGLVEEYLSWYGPMSGSSNRQEPEVTTVYVMAIFKTAQGLARHTTRKTQIYQRHLLGALLIAVPGEGVETGAYTLLRNFGLDPEELAGEFLSFLRKMLSVSPDASDDDDMDAWELHLRPGQRPPSASRVPRIDSEATGGRDLLRIRQDVEAFATLIAANSFEPPLSIGLFGDWGSGKSFFMQKLWDRVNELAALAERHRGSGLPAVFHRRIVQIKFNAWHYTEVNLWASLVTHIFEELHRYFSPQEEEAQKWNQALKRLDEATRLQVGAETVLKQAENGLETARAARDTQKLNLDQALKDAWSFVEREFLKPGQKEELEKTLGTAMFGQLQEELLLRRGEALRLKEQWQSSILMRSLGSWPSRGSFALVLALTVGLFGLVLWLSANQEVEQLTARLAEVVAFVGGISAWLGAAFKKTSNVLTTMEEIEAQVQSRLDQTQAGQNLRKAERALASAQSEVEQRRREVEEIRAEIQELRPGQRLSRFLQERAASSDYRKHLGLPALVRRDFEQLGKLMRVEISMRRSEVEAELRQGRIPDRLAEEIRRVDHPLPAGIALREIGTHGLLWELTDASHQRKIELEMHEENLVCRIRQEDLPPIDRIILYIDDLDRCPPRQVVDVLQAIHLLLAFPLFVVVVGVDARWISRSLRLHYRELWHHVDREEGNEEIAGATPLDYLEKIFQIPFWLDPLSPEVTREYLEGLIAKSLAPTVNGASPPPAEPPQKPVARQGNGGNGDGAHEAPAGEPSPGQPSLAAAGEALLAGGQEPLPQPPPPPPPPAEPAAPSPEPLVIQAIERDFMLYLAPLVGRSPRAVKRFLNVYRVFRASLDPGRVSGFLGTQNTPGDFREALVLLGLICGAPDVAPEFLRCLSSISSGDTLDAALEEIAASENNKAFAMLRARKEWKAVELNLRQLNDRLAREEQPPLSLSFLQENARSAIRYSFDRERL